MEILSESQAASLSGGRFKITVSPTIVINTAITNVQQTNAGANVAVGLLGGSASSGMAQWNAFSLFMNNR